MKNKDLITIASTALGTAALTVLAFWSAPLDAGNDGNALTPKISKPRLVANGIEMTLAAADDRTFNAGDEPTFELQAVNTTGESVTAVVQFAMTASSPVDALSRVPRLPTALWKHRESIVLQPNETKAVVVASRTKLPANSTVQVALQEPGPAPPAAAASLPVQPAPGPSGSARSGIVAMNFSTANPVASPMSSR